MLYSYSFSSFVFINKYPVVEIRTNQQNMCSFRHLKVSEALMLTKYIDSPDENGSAKGAPRTRDTPEQYSTLDLKKGTTD